jgi:hypothetical protein
MSDLTSNKVFTVNVSCKDNCVSDGSLLNMYHDIVKEEVNIAKANFDLHKFNKAFEQVHERDERGYGSWLSASATEGDDTLDGDNDTTNVESNVADPNFNKNFEEKVVSGSHIDVGVLHPEQMATLSGVTLGVNVNDDRSSSEVFTSMMNEHPEFTDVYSAFTHDNTVIDKVASFDESTRPRTLEELIAERDAAIDPKNASDYIIAYEKMKLEEELERERLLRERFDPTGSERKWLTNNSFLHDFSSVPSTTENAIISDTTHNH